MSQARKLPDRQSGDIRTIPTRLPERRDPLELLCKAGHLSISGQAAFQEFPEWHAAGYIGVQMSVNGRVRGLGKRTMQMVIPEEPGNVLCVPGENLFEACKNAGRSLNCMAALMDSQFDGARIGALAQALNGRKLGEYTYGTFVSSRPSLVSKDGWELTIASAAMNDVIIIDTVPMPQLAAPSGLEPVIPE